MLQPTYELLEDLLVSLGADTTTLSGQWVGLYTAISAGVGPNITLAQLTEATFTGYARKALTPWSVPYISSDANEVIDGPALHFSPSDTVTPNTIIGAFVGSASIAGELRWIDPFASPVPLAGPSQALTFIPRFGLPSTRVYDGGVPIN